MFPGLQQSRPAPVFYVVLLRAQMLYNTIPVYTTCVSDIFKNLVLV